MKPFYLRIVKEGKAWRWEFTKGKKSVSGGYGRTKADAKNDAGIWADLHGLKRK